MTPQVETKTKGLSVNNIPPFLKGGLGGFNGSSLFKDNL
jgi:hypothetical protein